MCKRSIVEAIGLSFLQVGHLLLIRNQRLLIAGCLAGDGGNYTWIINPNDRIAHKSEQHYSNTQEADSRIWRHAKILPPGTNLMISSPDTDVYNIGLSEINGQAEQPKNYIIQLNAHHSTEKRYLFLNNLQTAFLNDPDLSTQSTDNISLTIQSLFINTGCDFISYFKLYGKATVLNNFFQYASFICGNHMTGSLEQTQQCNKDSGFYPFYD